MLHRIIAAGAIGLAAITGAAAHHSFAMFDQEHPTEITGKVMEFRYTAPHSFILIEVAGKDGTGVVWNLEGAAPSILARDGWTSKTLKPGDELKMRIAPLRSGAPGGAWAPSQINFRDGRELDVSNRNAGFPESADVSR